MKGLDGLLALYRRLAEKAVMVRAAALERQALPEHGKRVEAAVVPLPASHSPMLSEAARRCGARWLARRSASWRRGAWRWPLTWGVSTARAALGRWRRREALVARTRELGAAVGRAEEDAGASGGDSTRCAGARGSPIRMVGQCAAGSARVWDTMVGACKTGATCHRCDSQ